MALWPPLLPTSAFDSSTARGNNPVCRKWALHRVLAHGSSNHVSLSADATHKDYYEILGVGVDASYEEIRRAYRLLQKKHHPDIAGPEGHAMTLLLNEAYKTLTSDGLRQAYRFSSFNSGKAYNQSTGPYTGFAYSSWNGPDRPQGIFVDENSCIGCRECVFHARETFFMDESSGSARVACQWGDSESQIKVALEACPVNCIHYVEKQDLPILEFLMRPQPKASNGVFGGGWERPNNVFMAANTFKRKISASSKSKGATASWQAETPAQRQARMDADFQMKAGVFWWLWSWGARHNESTSETKQNKETSNWLGLFGRSCTSHIFKLAVDPSEAAKVVEVVQEWAVTFASSSELPLPLPFKADPLDRGVKLTLVSASNGVVESKGSLLVTLKQEEDGVFLVVEREGLTGTGALPGERMIVQHLKDAVSGRDKSYSSYFIPRHKLH